MKEDLVNLRKAEIVSKYGCQYICAATLRIPPTLLSKIVRGRREPTAEHRKKLCKAFGAETIEKIFPQVDDA